MFSPDAFLYTDLCDKAKVTSRKVNTFVLFIAQLISDISKQLSS